MALPASGWAVPAAQHGLQHLPWPHLELVWADAGYLARQVNDAVATVAGLRIEIAKRSQPKAWELLPRRWVIERTFAWFGRNRRLARDYEGIVDAALAFIHLATIQLITRRLARL